MVHVARLREELFARWREVWLLQTTTSVLEWDEENGMPAAAAAHRGEQLGLLAGLIHDRLVDARMYELVTALADENDAHAKAVADLVDRHRKLPRALVLEEKAAAVAAQQAWLEARGISESGGSGGGGGKSGAFRGAYATALARVLTLKREVSSCLSDDGADPWECHLREFEPGARAADVVAVVEKLAASLEKRLAARSRERVSQPLNVRVGERARMFTIAALFEMLGYDLDRGALGENLHPFTSSLGPDDVRVAFRPMSTADGDLLDDLIAYVTHEIGHALYEQGVPRDLLPLPGGELRSLSLHESQSRLWENEVGKSRAFWLHLLPRLARVVPELADTGVDEVLESLKRPAPGAIRVGSDPVTYNLHIAIRVDLERALIGGELLVDDLPSAWSALYRTRLGVEVDGAGADGALQDGHWAAGMFGYFPTYTIGNVVAAQLMAAARRDIADLDARVAAGDTAPLRAWLARHVWQRAGLASLHDVVIAATGQELDVAAFLQHLG